MCSGSSRTYFNALRRAQRDIDVGHQRYTLYYLREMAEQFTALVDVRAFGPGERLVSSHIRAMCTNNAPWMGSLQLFPPEQGAAADYGTALLV
jgi:NitT/TauT family transport system substrate-binding protein